MNKLKFDQFSVWKHTAAQEAKTWASTIKPQLPDSELKAYEAGFLAGFDKLLSILKVQSLIEVSYK